jgi:hypothetical protein
MKCKFTVYDLRFTINVIREVAFVFFANCKLPTANGMTNVE